MIYLPISSATGFLLEFLFDKFVSGLLPGQSIRKVLQPSDEIQNCIIIVKGKINEVNYSPFGFLLKILGVFKVIVSGNT